MKRIIPLTRIPIPVQWEIILGACMLLGAILWNIRSYRTELTITVDPNDNAFQYALVDRTNQVWDFASRTCPKTMAYPLCHFSYLIDHWVPNWSEGYNLPYYYSHIPQILIVSSYRFFSMVHGLTNITLFQYYHVILFLLLCFFPLSIFLAFRIMKSPWIVGGIGALLASHISTDGLYGIDQSSFLWRGWGLSSQLFAMIYMPLAIASLVQWMKETENIPLPKFTVSDIFKTLYRPSWILTILFITLTTMGHLGMGLMLFISVPIIACTPVAITILNQESILSIWKTTRTALLQISMATIPPFILLSYWIIPTLINGQYHNVSFWDPIWKFDSYGAKEVLNQLFNGALFDFGRTPFFTILTFFGLGYVVKNKDRQEALFLLFIAFLLLYFGSTTWGSILYLIPSLNEFHQHRFIVGVHMIGLFLAPLGLYYLAQLLLSGIKTLLEHIRTEWETITIANSRMELYIASITVMLLCLMVPPIYRQTLNYSAHNDTLIQKANKTYGTEKKDAETLIQTLKKLPPGRVFAGRGGTWGKDFEVADTPYFMHLSTYGIPTVLWLPETWSNNADTEQYFSEDVKELYDTYAIRYIVAPPDHKPEPFWKLLQTTTTWKLYIVDGDTLEPNSSPYITTGVSPTIVYSNRTSFANVVRLWIQSDDPKRSLYPELRLRKTTPLPPWNPQSPLPQFSMVDEATYITSDGQTHSLFSQKPVYMTPWQWPQSFPQYQITEKTETKTHTYPISISGQTEDTDMVYKAKVTIEKTGEKIACPTCVVVLKQTYHPNWKATVNGKDVETINVFPSYVGIRLEEAGTYTVEFSYQPSSMKKFFVFLSILLAVYFLILQRKRI